MGETGVLVFFAMVAAYALVAARIEHLWLTGPIVFILMGLVVGPRGLSLLEFGLDEELVRTTTEVTLALLLFADASTVDLAALRKDKSTALRLLFIGLPLTVLAGSLVSWALLPALPFAVGALLAAILAPTDLSLGLAMFKNPRVPDRVRRVLNVESGLNDGIATPVVSVLIALCIADVEHTAGPLFDAVREISLGAGVGVIVGAVGGMLLNQTKRRGWSSGSSRQFVAFSLAMVSYLTAHAVHGNGFIAAFVGGLAFGAFVRQHAHRAAEFTEETGTVLSLAVWFIFGLAVGPVLLGDGLQWRPILYAVLSLTVIRMLPVALSLIGSKDHRSTVLFVGWFGPRGLASVVFLLMGLSALGEAGLEVDLLFATAGWTILLSVILHGISAGPVAAWYGGRAARFAPGSPELEPPTAAHVRRRGLASPSSTSRT